MIKRFALLFASIGLLMCAVIPAAPALAVTANDVFSGVCTTAEAKKSPTCQTTTADPISGPNGIIIRIAKIVAAVGGVVAVFMMVSGGFMYVTSGGDTNKVQNAKKTILFAAIGLVVIGLAQGIIAFIISRVH